ncbi:MAG: CHASE domain-containing protein [Candidatus Tectimicrobiota bacterium]
MTSRAPSFMPARWRLGAALLIILVGVTLSVLLFQARLFQQPNQQEAFSQRAALGATALQRSLQEHLEVLYGLSALYTAAAQPLQLTPEAFRELARGPLKRYAGVQALGWVPRIAAAERDAYVAAARKSGLADFQLTEWTPQMHMAPASRREVYYPIFYIEPLESQRAAVGFNLGAIPSYMEAMHKALSTEEATASAWRALTQDTGEQFGFLLFVPVYRQGLPHGTFEERRKNLQGFMMAMFLLGTLVEQSLQGMTLGPMGAELADVSDAASKYFLSLQLGASQVTAWNFLPRPSAQAETIRAGIHWETTFNVAGRRWSLLAYPLTEGHGTYAWQEWGLLGGGLLCSLLGAAFFLVRWR